MASKPGIPVLSSNYPKLPISQSAYSLPSSLATSRPTRRSPKIPGKTPPRRSVKFVSPSPKSAAIAAARRVLPRSTSTSDVPTSMPSRSVSSKDGRCYTMPQSVSTNSVQGSRLPRSDGNNDLSRLSAIRAAHPLDDTSPTKTHPEEDTSIFCLSQEYADVPPDVIIDKLHRLMITADDKARAEIEELVLSRQALLKVNNQIRAEAEQKQYNLELQLANQECKTAKAEKSLIQRSLLLRDLQTENEQLRARIRRLEDVITHSPPPKKMQDIDEDIWSEAGDMDDESTPLASRTLASRPLRRHSSFSSRS